MVYLGDCIQKLHNLEPLLRYKEYFVRDYVVGLAQQATNWNFIMQ